MSKFSLISVVLNDLDGLRQTVKSIDEQKDVTFEHIIIDGGSGDGTLEWLENHTLPYRKIFQLEEKGIYEAMNLGVKLSRGEWVHFINAGDTYTLPTSLKTVEDHCLGDRDLIYSDVYRTISETTKVWKQRPPFWLGIFRNICHQGVFYRRPILPVPAYETHFRVGSDFDTLLRIQMEHPNLTVYHLPEPLVSWKTGGYSTRNAREALLERQVSFKSRIHSLPILWLNLLNLYRQRLKLRFNKWDKVN